jgi:transposase
MPTRGRGCRGRVTSSTMKRILEGSNLLPNVTSAPNGLCNTIRVLSASTARSSFQPKVQERADPILRPRRTSVMSASDTTALTRGHRPVRRTRDCHRQGDHRPAQVPHRRRLHRLPRQARGSGPARAGPARHPRQPLDPQDPAVHAWLLRHPGVHFHFTPTYGSWMNLVERWFSALATKKLQRSAHRSVKAFAADITDWVETWNQNPSPSCGPRPPTRSCAASPATALPSTNGQCFNRTGH